MQVTQNLSGHRILKSTASVFSTCVQTSVTVINYLII